MEPLVVKPKVGFDAIGVGVTKGYELIGAGEIEAIKIGRATRLTVPSIKAYIERQRTASQRASA